MPYRIDYSPRVYREDMPKVPDPYRGQIKHAIETRLAVDPGGVGKPLRYNLKGCWSLRVGDWRVLYRIKGDTVNIFSIANRRDAYE
jgi:mRNA interferase RelE/StbE